MAKGIPGERVMLVRAELPDGGVSVGSGTLVDERLVLTAAHVVFGDHGASVPTIRVGRPGIEKLSAARVIWPERFDPGETTDAALLEITGHGWTSPRWLGPVRWGRLTGRAGDVSCEAVGFPRVLRDPDGARIEDQISAQINPGTARSTGARYDLHVSSSAPVTPPDDPFPSPWSGASGAGVFAAGLLIGVLVIDRPGFAHDRLTAVPAHRLLADAQFRAHLADRGISIDIASVELSGLLAPLYQQRKDRPSPASLLRAEAETVPFRGRAAEMAELTTWCTSSDQYAVWLMAGPGGQGKTRLARELARKLTGIGWVAGFLMRELPGQQLDMSSVADTATPLLLIMDYAETHTSQLIRLASVAWNAADAPPIRIVLLARSTGDWWEQLRRHQPDAFGAATISTLAALDDQLPSRRAAYASAATAFAAALAVVNPDTNWDRIMVREGPPGDLDADRFGSALSLQMSALLSVLRSGPDLVRSESGRPLEEQVLDHEKRYWEQTATDRSLSLHPATLGRSVAAATLLAATTETDALNTLSRVPGLRGLDEDRRLAVARWLRDLYPNRGSRYWAALQPDRLAERHVVDELAASPDMANACLHSLDNDQAVEALTILARACTHHPAAPRLIAAAVRADLPGLGTAAVRAAVQTGGALGGLLADVIGDAQAPREVLLQIFDAIPFDSVTLAQANLILTRRIVQTLPDDAEPAERARWADQLAVALRHLGRLDQALPVAQEVVSAYRALARTDPDRFRGDLASSLQHLGAFLGELGRDDEAMLVGEEAATIYRQLAKTDPGRYLDGLAASVESISIWYSALERPADALPAVQEAVGIWRQLARSDPDRHLFNLARSLGNLGEVTLKLGQAADALPATEEAIAIFRQLASTDPDSYRPFLAGGLDNLGNEYSEVGRPADALPVAQEATAIYRELVQANPDRYRPGLARSLHDLGDRYSELGRPADALPVAQEAVAIYRELAQTNPDRLRPRLASSLHNLAATLSELGRPAEALPASQEAIAIYRELAGRHPDRYRRELAVTLHGLGVTLSALGRDADALPVIVEVVAIYRDLADAGPDRYRPDLARSLEKLDVQYLDLRRDADALPVAEETVAVYRDLADTSPDRYRPDLGRSLNNLGVQYSRTGHRAEALSAAQEAVAIQRGLTQTDPGRHRPILADFLDNLGLWYSNLGRPADALPATEEAVAIYRELAQPNPDRYRPSLARCLNNLGAIHSKLNQHDKAAIARTEAEALLAGFS